MVTLLYIIFFLSCIVLIATILLQPGKADAGALFTSNISSTAFGPRGTQSVLSKFTIGTAAVFMLTALLLSMPAITGDVSVLNSVGNTTTTTETTVPATQPTDNSNNNNTNTGNVAPAAVETNSSNSSNGNTTAPANK